MSISAEESCAINDMRLGGLGMSSSTAQAFNWHAGTTTVTASEQSIACIPFDSPEQHQRINFLKPIVQAKMSYNSDVKSQRLLTGLGYCLYIIPGIILYSVYNNSDQPKIDAINAMYSTDQERIPAMSH